MVTQFQALPPSLQHDFLWDLVQKCEVMQLRKIYWKMSSLLSFDFVSQLPSEIAERIFLYLDASTLCRASACCKAWRHLANSDKLWYCLCERRNWLVFGQLNDPHWSVDERPLLLKAKTQCNVADLQTGPLQPSLCHWKLVYIKAYMLSLHWEQGVYKLSPLLKAHRDPITAMDCDGSTLVTGSKYGITKRWDLTELTCTCTFSDSHTDEVTSIIMKDGLVATGCADGAVRIFDAYSGHCIYKFQGHSVSVECIAFDGHVVISGGDEGSILSWDVSTGQPLHSLLGHTDGIKCMAINEDLLVSGSWDKTLRLWNIKSGLCKKVLNLHTEGIYCCLFDHKQIISGGGDGYVMVWDTPTGEHKLTLSGHKEEVYCLQYNEQHIVSGSADSTIRVWSHTGSCLHVLQGHIGVVRCIHLMEDRLVSAGDCKRVMVWNAKSGKLLHTVHKQQTKVHLLWADNTRIVTIPPDPPGLISIINYW